MVRLYAQKGHSNRHGPYNTQSRLDDRRLDSGERFSSNILPKYLRRIPSIDNLIPVLYLKGISTNDFGSVLSDILGEGASGFFPTNIARLKKVWGKDYNEWRKRDLSGKDYVYFWVDGIYFNVRLDDNRSCVLLGQLTGTVIRSYWQVQDGYRVEQGRLAQSLRYFEPDFKKFN